MHLTPGTRIGNYEVVSPLGAGGMGEVYRARDLRLDRTVAIKALPPAFAREPERLARFEREARLLASLDHPNIAGIHGIEDSGGAPYLVLELVEGETLAQRLARGPLGARETLEIGAQIAAAIEAAHERDVVHRDLKPGNVMFSTSGVAKVLDFGLAKGGASTAAGAGGSLMPTAAALATADGIILGTAPYMSPEQARGQLVDRRTDVWAFGCVLYECLSGRQAFAGDTVSDVIARILEREPDWSMIPAATPTRLRDLVKRCLTKEVKDRPRDIGDLRRELTSIAQELSAPASGMVAQATTPSLAVLYFENLASDQESEYFCAGITEDILTDLSKIKGLRVASRNAVARYRGAPVDISRVAAELGVRAVLEGSVRRAGDRVRITAQLINAADGFHLWAERYDRTLQDVFAVQEEIASSIAAALRVALSPAESANLAKDRPNDVRAYDLYLKGRAQYGRYTAESLRQALELFHQAIAIDPNYALAWAGIADCHGQMVQWGATQDREETLRLGLEAARRAITLNPGLPEAHKAEGLVLRYLGDREGQRRAIARALEANPRFTPALINMAVERFCLADLAGAERLVRRTLEVDPQDAFATTWLAVLTGLTRRDEEMIAIAGALRKLSSDPFYVTASWFFRVWAALHHGDVAAAGQAVRESAADDVDPANLRAMEALVAARSGRAGEAKAMLPELERAASLGAGVLLLAAETALLVGESDRALRFMARPVILDMAPIMVRLEPAVHPLIDLTPFAPRRRDGTLVWPLEAPMIDVARHALFREVRVESGRPQGSNPLVDGAVGGASSSSL
jgi:serine/threonine protein kinase/Tfp pilus assembly protein PilF